MLGLGTRLMLDLLGVLLSLSLGRHACDLTMIGVDIYIERERLTDGEEVLLGLVDVKPKTR